MKMYEMEREDKYLKIRNSYKVVVIVNMTMNNYIIYIL